VQKPKILYKFSALSQPNIQETLSYEDLAKESVVDTGDFGRGGNSINSLKKVEKQTTFEIPEESNELKVKRHSSFFKKNLVPSLNSNKEAFLCKNKKSLEKNKKFINIYWNFKFPFSYFYLYFSELN